MGHYYFRETFPDGSEKYRKLFVLECSSGLNRYHSYCLPTGKKWGFNLYESDVWVMRMDLKTRKLFRQKGVANEIYYKNGFFGKYAKVDVPEGY